MIYCLNGKHRSAQVAATCLAYFFREPQAAFNEVIVWKSCLRGPAESPDHSSPDLPRSPEGRGVWRGGDGYDAFCEVRLRVRFKEVLLSLFSLTLATRSYFALGLVSRWYGHPPLHRRTVMQREWHTPRDGHPPGETLPPLLRLLADEWPRASGPVRRAVLAGARRCLQGLG